jgi:DNA repair exonuclease SbcCD ATPase subunit
MEQKDSKIFSKEMMQAVSAFCESKEIKDVDNFIYLCFKQGFDIKKYGFLGKTLNEGEKDLKTDVIDEKQVIKEIIVEKRVEIPVEVIKEVEKIVEVIKEVPVDRVIEKEIYITDDNQVNELGEKIAELKEEMSKKDKELDELRRNLDIKLDDTQTKMLQETLQKLRKELLEKNKKIEDLEKINQNSLNKENPAMAIFMKGSNLKSNL